MSVHSDTKYRGVFDSVVQSAQEHDWEWSSIKCGVTFCYHHSTGFIQASLGKIQ